MKNRLLVIALILVGFIFFLGNSNNLEAKKKKQRTFVGVKKCARCHKKKKQGNQYGVWKKSKHAKAFKSLKGKKAMEIAKRMGIKDPQKSGKCLKCHVTGHGIKAKYFGKKAKASNGVTCEACHGAGKDYKKNRIMKKLEKAIAKGLIKLKPKDCATCHNKDVPKEVYKGPYDFKKMFLKIKHYKPKHKPSKDWQIAK